MKNKYKKIVIVLVSMLLFIVTPFATDYIRLKDSDNLYKRPLITWKEIKTEYMMEYYSFGYKVYYHLDSDRESVNAVRF